MPIEYDLSNDEYHNERPGYSSTFIKTTHLKSIYHAKNSTSSIALSIADMGTAVHAIVLEPEKEIVRCGPETRRGNAWKEAYAEAEADGVTLLPEKEYHQVFDIAHSLLAHPEAKDILTADDKICEASIFVEHPRTGLELKVRPDIFVPSMGVMADVKTTVSSVPSAFARQVFSYGWHIQGAFYKLCAELAGWEVDSFAFLSVEKERPFTAHVHYLSPEVLDYGERIVEQILTQIASCEERQNFSPFWGTHSVIELPGWMAQQQRPEEI